MNADRCKGIAEASGFADVLSCKKSSIRLRSLERPPAIVLIETISVNVFAVGLLRGWIVK
jgi:hypothetical protein